MHIINLSGQPGPWSLLLLMARRGRGQKGRRGSLAGDRAESLGANLASVECHYLLC
jgi:hypothetical protein